MSAQETNALPEDRWDRYDDLTLTPILEAALEAFQEKGYHGTTVRDVATRAGLTMPALYYHHGNKEGILVALLDMAMNDLMAHIEASHAAAGDDTRQQFVNLVTVVCLHTTYRRGLASLHPEYRFLGDKSRKSYVAKRDAIYNRMVELLERGAHEGVFAPQDSRFSARALLGMLIAITDWYHQDGPSTPEEIAASYVGLSLNLVGAHTSASMRESPAS
jgi:TetR/AcrR family transcriptional regulator, cholesterol catabolism regulator